MSIDEKSLQVLKVYLPYACIIALVTVYLQERAINRELNADRLKDQKEIGQQWRDLYFYSTREEQKSRAVDYDTRGKNNSRAGRGPDAGEE